MKCSQRKITHSTFGIPLLWKNLNQIPRNTGLNPLKTMRQNIESFINNCNSAVSVGHFKDMIK